jgi:cell division protein FtsL
MGIVLIACAVISAIGQVLAAYAARAGPKKRKPRKKQGNRKPH